MYQKILFKHPPQCAGSKPRWILCWHCHSRRLEFQARRLAYQNGSRGSVDHLDTVSDISHTTDVSQSDKICSLIPCNLPIRHRIFRTHQGYVASRLTYGSKVHNIFPIFHCRMRKRVGETGPFDICCSNVKYATTMLNSAAMLNMLQQC